MYSLFSSAAIFFLFRPRPGAFLPAAVPVPAEWTSWGIHAEAGLCRPLSSLYKESAQQEEILLNNKNYGCGLFKNRHRSRSFPKIKT